MKAFSRSTAYLADAETWAQDREAQRAASLRLAWRLAAAAGLVAGLEAIALAALAPLKTAVPYTLLVDRQTGYLETARGVKLGPLSESEALTQAFLAQYVLARETFDATDLNANYQKVAAWSHGPARATYLHAFDRKDPGSLLSLTPPATVVSVRVKNISMLGKDSALVRFDTERRDAGQDAPAPAQSWVAVIRFRYAGAPAPMRDRLLNPLGFQVTAYRRDAEAAPNAAYGGRSEP